MKSQDELNIIIRLGRAWGNTSKMNNCFETTIKSIKWDCSYLTQDETTNFVKDGLVIEVHKMSPFETTFKPMYMSKNLGIGSI